MVPHLATSLTGPINELEQRILDSMPAIERWFRLEWMEHTPPFYTSVDIRNAGFKLAPVDTNLFPGGWNNLTENMLPLAVQAAMAAVEKICPEIVPNDLREELSVKSDGLMNAYRAKRRGLIERGWAIDVEAVQRQFEGRRALVVPSPERRVAEGRNFVLKTLPLVPALVAAPE